MKKKIYLSFLLIYKVIISAAVFGQQSTFNLNTEGWKVTPDGTGVTWYPTGGNPGGYCSGYDTQAGGIFKWSAPSVFLGCKSDSFKDTLSFDLALNCNGSLNFEDVVLSGSGMNIYYNTSYNPNKSTAWTHYDILLDTMGWERNYFGSGIRVTSLDFQSILANLTGILIRGEFCGGFPDISGIDNVILNPIPTPSNYIVASCDSFYWYGIFYDKSGTYIHTPIAGCSLEDTLVLTVKSTSTSTTSVSICPVQLPYTWNGKIYKTGGSYKDTLVNAAGCDSVITLILIVKSTSASTVSVSICPAQLPYTWNGKIYKTGGSYKDTLVNAAGCDSVVTLILIVKSTSASTVSVSICPAQLPYTWNGNTYKAGGSYKDTLVNAAGCDSIANLDLNISDIFYSLTIQSICSKQFPYHWNGKTYSKETTDSVKLINISGCDSIAILKLTVKTNSTSIANKNICPIELPYIWNGTTCNAGGSYTDTLVASNGCDSNLTLNLAVLQKPDPDLGNVKTLCKGKIIKLYPGKFNSYLWQDGSTQDYFLVKQPGLYSVTVTNSCGAAKDEISISEKICDIIIPSAFSPNGDYINDQWYIINLSSHSDCTVDVFDRFGQVVYHSTGYQHPWDGTFKGKPVPVGVYYYIIAPGRKKDLIQGSVTIIR